MATVDKLLKYLAADNIADLLDDDKLDEIGRNVVTGYQIDDDSRHQWLEINKKAINLIKTAENELDSGATKDFPFKNSAKVVFNMLGPAVIQLASRLITQITRNNRVAECAVLGPDHQEINPQTGQPTGQGVKQAKGKRVSDFLNYKLLIESDNWLSDEHKLCHILSAWGMAFKEVYYDKINKTTCHDVLPPEDVIINHNITSIDKARRITIRTYLSRNDIVEQQRIGQFLEIDLDTISSSIVDNTDHENDSREKQPVYEFLRQICWIDLDEDGYEEPYYAIVHNQSHKVFSIYPAFDIEDINIDSKGKIISIKCNHGIVVYQLIDDPEGKFYSLGLNHVLYHSAKSITTVLRELIDAGNLANAAKVSGFITRAVKTKERSIKIKMGEFVPVDISPDQKLADQFFPLPFGEPSQVLLGLLELLVQNAKETGFMTDILTGEAETQNVPATTTLAMVEQGTRAFKPLIQKLYSSLKREFKVWFKLQAKYIDRAQYFVFQDQQSQVQQDDFDPTVLDIAPVADPTMSSEAHKYARLQALSQIMQQLPQAVNMQTGLLTYFTGLEFPDPASMVAPPQPAPPDPKLMEVQLKSQIAQADQQNQMLKNEIAKLKIQLDATKVDQKQQEILIKAHEAQAGLDRAHAEASAKIAQAVVAHKQVKIQQQEADTESRRVDIMAKEAAKPEPKSKS